MNHHLFDNCFDLSKFVLDIGKLVVVFLHCLIGLISILPVGIYKRFYDEQLFVKLVVHIVFSHGISKLELLRTESQC